MIKPQNDCIGDNSDNGCNSSDGGDDEGSDCGSLAMSLLSKRP